MRIWHKDLLRYLPEAQFKGQLRELVAIMRAWRDKGTTNHLLINRVMEYPKGDFYSYFLEYVIEYNLRYCKLLDIQEFREFCNREITKDNIFDGWHNKEYLRVCMANLYEKNTFGIGKSAITDREWQRLVEGYKEITGEDYVI